ncbi:GGDEF domain-containing protein [bacterium]|nr:GGDEF domain-containing protein [bacterium]
MKSNLIFSIFNLMASEGFNEVFTVVIVLAMVGLGLLLYFSIKKEAKRVSEEREQPKATDGLISRRNLENQLDEFIRVYHLSKEATALIFELTNAQEISDSFGKNVEMQLKGKLIQNIVRTLPKNALFSEYKADNDSYLILLRGNFSRESLFQFTDHLIDVIETPIQVPHMEVQTSYTCYLGMSFYPTQAITSADLIAKADLALYMNVKTPNRRYSVYSSTFDETEKENLVYYNEVKSAIKNKEFTLYYQPIADYKNQNIVGYEALIRWQHPTLGVLSPNKFLSVLENSGDILWVGKWGISSICEFYNANPDIFNKQNVFFSINLSIKQLLNETIVSDFSSILHRFHVPTNVIMLEIEEYALYEKFQTISTVIKEFVKKGFKIAIDHFGLDSKNIMKLQEYDFSMVKLSSSDVLEISDSFVEKKMYDVLLDTCAEKNIKICSLRIEDRATVDKLMEAKVDYYQGYFVSAPKSTEDIIEFAKSSDWKK